jgi:outer membrane protein
MLLLGGGAVLLAFPATATAETLAEAIAFAFDTNPDILSQRAQMRAINERYIQARGQLGFTLDASASLEAQHALVDNSSTRSIDYKAETATGTLTLNQPIYTGGRARAQIQGALANVFVAYQNLRAEQNRVLNEVVTAYVDVQRDQQIVAINEDNVKLLEGQVEETRAKLAVRESTLTDRDQGFARIASARAQLVLSRSQLENSRSRYTAVVGRAPSALAEAPPLPKLVPNESDALALAEQGSPTLLAAEFQERASRAGVLQARAARMPSVSLRGDVFRGPLVAYDENLKNNNESVRVVVNMPLYSSGVVSSRIREAKARNDLDVNQIEASRRQVLLNVSRAWQQATASSEAAELYNQQVTAQEGAYKGNKLEQRFGLRTTIEALNAAQELNSARVNRAQAVHDAYAGQSALLAAAGKLDPAVFGVPVADDLAPDIKKLNSRSIIPWTPLIQALDSIGQPSVFDR